MDATKKKTIVRVENRTAIVQQQPVGTPNEVYGHQLA
jgi:hypothetical protein